MLVQRQALNKHFGTTYNQEAQPSKSSNVTFHKSKTLISSFGYMQNIRVILDETTKKVTFKQNSIFYPIASSRNTPTSSSGR